MKRLECLDGLRGVLALYVLLTHMAPFASLPPAMLWLLSHGEAAVDLFFVLSGFVIAAPVEHFADRTGPFLVACAARIFPVLLPAFAMAVMVQPLSIDVTTMPWVGPDSPAHRIWSDGWPATWATDLLAHLTMLHGVSPNSVLPDIWVSFLGAAWSLSTEWQFYALVAIIGARLGRGERRLWRLTILLLLIGTFGAIWHAGAPADWQFSRAFLPNKATYFALGVASIALLRNQEAWLRFSVVVGVALAAMTNGDALVFSILWLPGAVLLPLGATWWLRIRIELPALRYGRALAHAMLNQGAMPALLPGGIFSAISPAMPALFAGMALPTPAVRDGAALAMANTHLAHGFESLCAPEDHLATCAISPAPEQLLSRLVEQARRVVLGSSIVVRLSEDPIQAAQQRAQLKTLCGSCCPYRPQHRSMEKSDGLTSCTATRAECQHWLAGHSFARHDQECPQDTAAAALAEAGGVA